MEVKKCIKCGEIKHIESFLLDLNMRGNRRNSCNTCRNKQRYQKRLKNLKEEGKDKSIASCEKCGSYFKKSSFKTCFNCRKDKK